MSNPPTIRPIAAPASGVSLSLRDVRKTFDNGVLAVDDISLEITAGEFVAMLEPSGCGKSTLLRMVAQLDSPSAGSIRRETNPLSPRERARVRAVDLPNPLPEKQPFADLESPHSSLLPAGEGEQTAYVFQDANLLPWRTVLKNVALPLELRGVGKRERLEEAANALQQVGLIDFASRYPAQLSGGMRMRVSLARALVTSPSLLLLDEPFAALDEITRAHLDDQLRELWLNRRMTVLFVTHSITEAAFLADRAIVLTKRPASVVLDVAIDLPQERRNSLRGEANFARHTRILLDALEKGGG